MAVKKETPKKEAPEKEIAVSDEQLEAYFERKALAEEKAKEEKAAKAEAEAKAAKEDWLSKRASELKAKGYTPGAIEAALGGDHSENVEV